MTGTFRSYQELWITQSQRFSSRVSDAESRASIPTGTARSSRCAAANAFAFVSLLPPIPTRVTPRLARRSGTVDWAIAPYPPRMSTSTGHRHRAGRAEFINSFRNGSCVGYPQRPQDGRTGEHEADTPSKRGSVAEQTRDRAAEQRSEDRSETLHRVEGAKGAGAPAFRSEARDQGGAGYVDHRPASADAGMERDDERKARKVTESRDSQEEEGPEEHGPTHGPVQLRRPTPARGDPARDPRIHGDRGDLARDINPKDRRISQPIGLGEEDREEAVEGREASEQKEHREQVESERSRQPVADGISRTDEMDDPHREVPSPLDARLGVDDMNVPPIDSVDRFSCLELHDDSRGERQDRADQE